MNKKKVAFICVHNSCRSQIAEALGKHLASDVFESYSAGTETKLQINQDAVRVMKELYGIDMEAEGQYSVLIPVQPQYYAADGLMELLKVVKGIHQRFNPDLQIEGMYLIVCMRIPGK